MKLRRPHPQPLSKREGRKRKPALGKEAVFFCVSLGDEKQPMTRTIKITKSLVIMIVVLFFSSAHSQVTFQKTFTYTYFSTITDLVHTPDNGSVWVSGLYNGGSGHYFLTKLDSLFQLQWCKEIETTHDCYPNSAQVCADGGFIICGGMDDNSGYTNMFLTKTDSAGNILWTKTFGGWEHDNGLFVKQTNDGGFIASGKTLISSGDNAYIVKTDTNGNLLWSTTVSHSIISGNYAYSIDQTTDSGYIISGYSTGLGAGNYNGLLIRMDSTGNVLWTKTYGLNQWDQFRSVYQTIDNGFLIAGTTDTSNDNTNSREILLLKTDSAGNVLWSKIFGNVNDNFSFKMIKESDSSYLMVGYIVAPGTDIHLLKTDLNGNITWSKAYGTTNAEQGHDVIPLNDGYLIGGTSNSHGYLIKTVINGISNCNETAPPVLTGTITYPVLTVTYFTGTNDTSYSVTVTSTPYTPLINTLCSSVSIEENTADVLFSISPNPTDDYVTVHFNLTSPQQTSVSLFNLCGQKLKTVLTEKQLAGEYEMKVDMRDLEAGIYFVKMSVGGKEEVRKVVKY